MPVHRSEPATSSIQDRKHAPVKGVVSILSQGCPAEGDNIHWALDSAFQRHDDEAVCALAAVDGASVAGSRAQIKGR